MIATTPPPRSYHAETVSILPRHLHRRRLLRPHRSHRLRRSHHRLPRRRCLHRCRRRHALRPSLRLLRGKSPRRSCLNANSSHAKRRTPARRGSRPRGLSSPAPRNRRSTYLPRSSLQPSPGRRLRKSYPSCLPVCRTSLFMSRVAEQLPLLRGFTGHRVSCGGVAMRVSGAGGSCERRVSVMVSAFLFPEIARIIAARQSGGVFEPRPGTG